MTFIEEYYILEHNITPVRISTDVSEAKNSSETLLHFQWTDYAALQLHNHGCRNLKYGTGH
jgi:hypothetical protein